MIANFLAECEYNDAYKTALFDIYKWFENHSESLKNNRLYNQKGIKAVLKAIYMNSTHFMEYGDETEFIVNKDDKNNIIIKLGENV